MMKFSHDSHSSFDRMSRITLARSRSICCENKTGGKGAAAVGLKGIDAERARLAGLGEGWKCSPREIVRAGETTLLAEIEGEGAIQQIWITPLGGQNRHLILRMYWDGQETPSVEVPLGDFFCNGWETPAYFDSLVVAVNPRCAFNCYWEMPFRKHARITLSNENREDVCIYYQINYVLGDVADDAGYFHASFRRVNPTPMKTEYVVLDGVKGTGHYVGTYLAYGSNSGGWWGEGEMKFFLDGDVAYPTICGTGTEDYFCGSYSFEDDATREYREFADLQCGFHQVLRPDGKYRSQQRFGMYRWHLSDPIRFASDIRVTLQALGWAHGEPSRYRTLQDDLATVAFWYQTLPTVPFPELPDYESRQVY